METKGQNIVGDVNLDMIAMQIRSEEEESSVEGNRTTRTDMIDDFANTVRHQPDWLAESAMFRGASAVDAATAALANSKAELLGIEKKLKYAMTYIDCDGDPNSINPQEFRQLWKLVWGGDRTLDDVGWAETERIFADVDTDHSGTIELKELIAYLSLHQSNLQILRGDRPRDLKDWLWLLVSPYSEGSTFYKPETETDKKVAQRIWFYKLLSQCMIFLYISIIFAESLPNYQNSDGSMGSPVMFALEAVCVAFFTLEFVAWAVSYRKTIRFLDIDQSLQRIKKVRAPRGPFQVSFWLHQATIIDLCSIVPFFFELGYRTEFSSGLFGVLRASRMLRVLRILRSLKYGDQGMASIPKLMRALRNSLTSLWWLFFLIVVIVTTSSTFMYYAERQDSDFDFTVHKWIRRNDSKYDDAGQPLDLQSIPAAMWWSVVTITTVGYGDVTPITTAGKCIATATMLASLVVVSYPIILLGSVFQDIQAEISCAESKMLFRQSFYSKLKNWRGLQSPGLGKTVNFADTYSTMGGQQVKPPDVAVMLLRLDDIVSPLVNQIGTLCRRVEQLESERKFLFSPSVSMEIPTELLSSNPLDRVPLGPKPSQSFEQTKSGVGEL
eukprot:TRINITY_DN12722_c0_g1_i3.p1 TRINITY_DN12722_c0_g1~~TRINITY_DN12722_c0_g1_i3.p1  ORF type:complete len:611 (+),score=84.52 TRINITY_DN12722_c0_g1_i3:53-1885(+)